MNIDFIFQIAILIMSVVIHEVAHGYAALALGDVTAKYAGRLTLNPIKHLDPFGSVILPLIMSMIPGGIMLAWAKPVPYNPYNLRNKRWGELLVAIAGPISNVLIAILVGLAIRVAIFTGFSGPALTLAVITVIMNLYLAFFNMIPIPPLDGSKVLMGLFPKIAPKLNQLIGISGIIIILLVISVFPNIVVPAVIFFAQLLTGISL